MASKKTVVKKSGTGAKAEQKRVYFKQSDFPLTTYKMPSVSLRHS